MSDDNRGIEVEYDPAHIAAMIVLVMFGLGILFWLFWSILVFKGGILQKLWLLASVVAGRESFAAIKPELWDGWVINVTALGILILFIIGIFFLFRKKKG